MSPDLLTPPGQGDDGRADSALLAALRSGDRAALADALPGARVFVGVEARALTTDVLTGADKQSEMVLVTLRTSSGSGALPVFSAVDVMAAWRSSVRPVPVTLPDACAEAVRLGLAAVVIDLGGPAPVTLDVRPAAGGDADGAASRGPRVLAGEDILVGPAADGVLPGWDLGTGDPGDEEIVADEASGGLLRPRPVPLDAQGRRRLRQALAGLPPGTEVWPAELAGSAGRQRTSSPVLAVALGGSPGPRPGGVPGADGAGGVDVDAGADEVIAEIVSRLRGVIAGPDGESADSDGERGAAGVAGGVLLLDPTEVPAVRAYLGRGVRPPRRLWPTRRGTRA